MHDSESPQRTINPTARLIYDHDGATYVRWIYLEIGGLLSLTKTLKWAYCNDVPVTIEWFDHESKT